MCRMQHVLRMHINNQCMCSYGGNDFPSGTYLCKDVLNGEWGGLYYYFFISMMNCKGTLLNKRTFDVW